MVLRKQLRRREVLTFFASLPPCLIGIEACSASHYWARELTALGHQVRMMPARYVKPYVQRGKSDALDAAAICSAVPVNRQSCPSQDTAISHPGANDIRRERRRRAA